MTNTEFEPKDIYVRRSIDEPIRENLTHDEEWHSDDAGFILCWEKGRKLSIENQELAEKARAGGLPVLSWKGGYDKKLQSKKPKYGSFHYLATLQGLRGEDLHIDHRKAEGHRETCSITNMTTIFTSNIDNFRD